MRCTQRTRGHHLHQHLPLLRPLLDPCLPRLRLLTPWPPWPPPPQQQPPRMWFLRRRQLQPLPQQHPPPPLLQLLLLLMAGLAQQRWMLILCKHRPVQLPLLPRRQQLKHKHLQLPWRQ